MLAAIANRRLDQPTLFRGLFLVEYQHSAGMWFERHVDTRSDFQALSGPGVLHVVLSCWKPATCQSAVHRDCFFTHIECGQSMTIAGQGRNPDDKIAFV